jgi:hypothetical protein
MTVACPEVRFRRRAGFIWYAELAKRRIQRKQTLDRCNCHARNQDLLQPNLTLPVVSLTVPLVEIQA